MYRKKYLFKYKRNNFRLHQKRNDEIPMINSNYGTATVQGANFKISSDNVKVSPSDFKWNSQFKKTPNGIN